MVKEFLLEKDMNLSYQKIREKYVENSRCSVLDENSARVIFKDNNSSILYKLAKNALGFEINKKEVSLSGANDVFLETYCVNKNDYILVKSPLNTNSVSTNPASSYIKTLQPTNLGLKRLILTCMLEHSYFSKDDRYKKRGVSIEIINQSYLKLQDEHRALSLNFSSFFIHKLIELSLKFDIEPGDIVAHSFLIDNKSLKLTQFGLTEDIYLNNMRTVFLQKLNVDNNNNNNNNISVRTSFIRQFDGSWLLNSDFEIDTIPGGYSSLEEFYENTFGKTIDFSDHSIYDKNNSFIKNE